jgi:hypothetical protein
MADGQNTNAAVTLSAALAQQIPGSTPTALSAAVTQALSATPQSALPVQFPIPLVAGPRPVPAPPKNHMPMILGISGGAVGLGLLALFLMRRGKKRR